LTWEDPLVEGVDEGVDALARTTSAIEWLRQGPERLRCSIAALNKDAELVRPRLTNWGERCADASGRAIKSEPLLAIRTSHTRSRDGASKQV